MLPCLVPRDETADRPHIRASRPGQCPVESSALLCHCNTPVARMHPGASTAQPTTRIGDQFPIRDDNSQQFYVRTSLATANARANRAYTRHSHLRGHRVTTVSFSLDASTTLSCRSIGRRRGMPWLGIAADVDAPSGETRGQSGILPLLANSERQLEVRHDYPRSSRPLVDHGN